MLDVNKLITENIDIWTSAALKNTSQGRGQSKQRAFGIQKLRELIFELAIRGKLVPQDHNEESSDLLIEKITSEKLALIKNKRIKKPKTLRAISEEEKLKTLPKGWAYERLGNIGIIFNGNSVSANAKETKYTGLENGLPFIATKDVGYGFEDFDYENGLLIPENEPKFKVAHKGAILICAEGGSAGKKCGIANRDICFGNKLFANELLGGIEPKFILATYLSPSFFEQFSNSMKGIIGGISANKFSELIISLPPIAEQARIVAKLEELMALCDQLEQQSLDNIKTHKLLTDQVLMLLVNSENNHEFEENWLLISEFFELLFTTEESVDDLKNAILQLAIKGKLVSQRAGDETAINLLEKIAQEKEQFVKDKIIKNTKPITQISESELSFEIPYGWSWCRIIECMDSLRDISYGIIKLEAEPKSGGVPTLRCSDVKPRYIDLANVRKVSPEIEAPYARTRLRGGEVLVNIRGTLGGVALVPDELKDYNIAREVAMLPLHRSISGKYIVNVINSPFFWSMIEANLKGIAYKGLNLNILRDFVIPLPPISEQHKIVSKVEELFDICDKLKSHIANAGSIKIEMAEALVLEMLNS